MAQNTSTTGSNQESPNLLSSNFFNSETFQNHALNLRKSIIFSPSMDSVQVGPFLRKDNDELDTHAEEDAEEEQQDEIEAPVASPRSIDYQQAKEPSVANDTDSFVSAETSKSPLKLKKKTTLDRTIELKMTNSPSFQGLADMLEHKVKRYESSSNIKILAAAGESSVFLSSPLGSPVSSRITKSRSPSPLKKIPNLEIDKLLPLEDTPKVYQSAIMNGSSGILSSLPGTPAVPSSLSRPEQPQESRSPNLIQLSDSPLLLPPSVSTFGTTNSGNNNTLEIKQNGDSKLKTMVNNNENVDIFGTPKNIQQSTNTSDAFNKTADHDEKNIPLVEGLEMENIAMPVISVMSPGSEKVDSKKTSIETIAVSSDAYQQRSSSMPVFPSKSKISNTPQQPKPIPETVKPKKKGFMSFFRSNKRVTSLQTVPLSKSTSNITNSSSSNTNKVKPPLRQSQSFSVNKTIGSKKEANLSLSQPEPHVAKRSTSSTSLFSAFKRKSKLMDPETLQDQMATESKKDIVNSDAYRADDKRKFKGVDSDNGEHEQGKDNDGDHDEPKQRLNTPSVASLADEFNEDFNAKMTITTPTSQRTSRFTSNISHQTNSNNNNVVLSPRSIRSRSSMNIDQGETLFPKSLNPQEVESIVSIERSRSFNRSTRSKRGSVVPPPQLPLLQLQSSAGETVYTEQFLKGPTGLDGVGLGIDFSDEVGEFDHIIDQIQLIDRPEIDIIGEAGAEDDDDYKQFIEFADIINFGSSDMELGLNYDSGASSNGNAISPVIGNIEKDTTVTSLGNQKAMFNYTANYQESPVLEHHQLLGGQASYKSSPLVPQEDESDNDSIHIPENTNYQSFDYKQEEEDPYKSHTTSLSYQSDSSFSLATNIEDSCYQPTNEPSPLTSPFLQQNSFINYKPQDPCSSDFSMFDPTHPHPAQSVSGGPRMVRPISMSFRGLKSPAFNNHAALSIPPPSLSSLTPSSSVASSPVRSTHQINQGSRNRGVRFSNRLTIFETYHEEEYDRHPDLATCNELNPQLAIMIKNELNELKSEMEVHVQSRCNTHFF